MLLPPLQRTYIAPLFDGGGRSADFHRLGGKVLKSYENFSFMKKCLEEAGLNVDSTQLFFGCARALYGTKRPLLSTSGASRYGATTL